jgi:hypothetical protein
MAASSVLKSIIEWLRAGYPEGVPEIDYIPLFALLGSHLTDADIATIADELAGSSDPASGESIRAAVRAAGDGELLDVDVTRVKSRLAAGGWPLATPEQAAGAAQ